MDLVFLYKVILSINLLQKPTYFFLKRGKSSGIKIINISLIPTNINTDNGYKVIDST